MPIGQLGWHTPILLTLTPPVMVATAAMRAPSLIVAIAMQPPAMHATALILTPSISMSTLVQVPLMQAAAAMLAPSIGVTIVTTIAPPVMPATAALLTPTIGKGVGLTAPLLTAAAAMPTPTVTVLNPVTFDAAGSGASTTSATSLSWTQIAVAGATALVDIFVVGGTAPTAVTYGGTAMTFITSIGLNNTTSSPSGALRRYRLTNVAGGAQTVTATWPGGVVAIGNSVSYKNVVTIGSTTSAFGSGSSVSQAATATPGQMLVQSFAAGSNSATAWSAISGGTNRYNTIAGSITKYGLLISDAAANATFTANNGASADNWAGLNTVLSPT